MVYHNIVLYYIMMIKSVKSKSFNWTSEYKQHSWRSCSWVHYMRINIIWKKAASIWFEIWESWDPGPKISIFLRQISEKFRFLVAISPPKIRFSGQKFPKFPITFFQSLTPKYRLSNKIFHLQLQLTYSYANYSISLSKETTFQHTYCAW